MLKLHRNLYLLRNFSKYKPYDCDAKFKSYSNSSSTENSGFIPVYKFPAVRVLSTINRLKLYQSGLTAVAIPTSIALNQLGILAQDGLHFTIGLGNDFKYNPKIYFNFSFTQRLPVALHCMVSDT